MMAPAAAERLTGDRIGGISPLGQKRHVPASVDTAIAAQPYGFINGGRRGCSSG